MNILHLSDLHFGPRHWDGDDEVLLEKINSYPAAATHPLSALGNGYRPFYEFPQIN